MVLQLLHSTRVLCRATWLNSYKVATHLPRLLPLGLCFPRKVLWLNSHKSDTGLALALGIQCFQINCSKMSLRLSCAPCNCPLFSSALPSTWCSALSSSYSPPCILHFSQAGSRHTLFFLVYLLISILVSPLGTQCLSPISS